MKPVTQYETLECKVFFFFPGTHNSVKIQTNETYGAYYQGMFLAMYYISEAYRFNKVVAWLICLHWSETNTIRNFFQDRSSHIWTVTNAFQVRIWNGGW